MFPPFRAASRFPRIFGAADFVSTALLPLCCNRAVVSALWTVICFLLLAGSVLSVYDFDNRISQCGF